MKKEISVSQILAAAEATIGNPNKSILDELGISNVDVGLFIISPQWFVAKKAYEWIKNKINANQEKERMYREIIQKQQAAINKQQAVNRELEKRLRDSQASNLQNKEEIMQLRLQLKNLKDAVKVLKQAEAKVA